MRISDWSSDVCSSDLSALLRTDESNFKDMVLLAESFSIEDFFVPAFRNIASLAMDSLNQGGLPSFSGIMAASREREIDIGGVETLNDLADNPALKFVSPTKLNQSCATLTELGNRRRIRQELQSHIDGLKIGRANV